MSANTHLKRELLEKASRVLGEDIKLDFSDTHDSLIYLSLRVVAYIHTIATFGDKSAIKTLTKIDDFVQEWIKLNAKEVEKDYLCRTCGRPITDCSCYSDSDQNPDRGPQPHFYLLRSLQSNDDDCSEWIGQIFKSACDLCMIAYDPDDFQVTKLPTP